MFLIIDYSKPLAIKSKLQLSHSTKFPMHMRQIPWTLEKQSELVWEIWQIKLNFEANKQMISNQL